MKRNNAQFEEFTLRPFVGYALVVILVALLAIFSNTAKADNKFIPIGNVIQVESVFCDTKEQALNLLEAVGTAQFQERVAEVNGSYEGKNPPCGYATVGVGIVGQVGERYTPDGTFFVIEGAIPNGRVYFLSEFPAKLDSI